MYIYRERDMHMYIYIYIYTLHSALLDAVIWPAASFSTRYRSAEVQKLRVSNPRTIAYVQCEIQIFKGGLFQGMPPYKQIREWDHEDDLDIYRYSTRCQNPNVRSNRKMS